MHVLKSTRAGCADADGRTRAVPVLRALLLGVFLSALVACSGCPPANPPDDPCPSEGETPSEGEPQEGQEPPPGPIHYSYVMVAVFPHDEAAFTQGLVYENGVFFEGTGLYGESSLRRVIPETGIVAQQTDLAKQYFGEGIAVIGDRIIQLTWREHVAFVYNKDTFERIGQFNYTGEGWGLAYDGARLIMSDGTPKLRFLDPITYQETGTIQVRDGGQSITRLNELEFIDGEVYANIWQTDLIARIDPATGSVTGWINLAGLLEAAGASRAPDVLNGIAYDAAADRLFVTGKKWPYLFEIDLVESASTVRSTARTP